jgi:lysophospholipase L1-like esterase
VTDPSRATADSHAPDHARRFLALGDSYTIGEGVAPADRWPVRLMAALRTGGTGVDVADTLIVARTGWTTDELSSGIDAAAPAGLFDLVSLLIGVNDQYRGRTADDYRAGFGTLLDRAIRFGAGDPSRVAVISIPDWGVTPFASGQDRSRIAAEIDAFNSVNRDEARRKGAHYVDVTGSSRRALHDPELVAGDGLHPSAKMYAEWVELVLPIARRALGGSG